MQSYSKGPRLFSHFEATFLLRTFTVVFMLYLFLVGVKVLSNSFRLLGEGFAESLINVTSSPVLALFSGLLATVLMQSSSATSSIIVGLVSSGSMSLAGAIPMIMGANLGTSVTNSLVSMGHLKDRLHFKRAFAAATIHDLFNILSVIILLPLELATGLIERLATWSAQALAGGSSSGVSFSSPIKKLITPFANGMEDFVLVTLNQNNFMSGLILITLSFSMIILSLSFIVRVTKKIVISNKGKIIERLLSKNPYLTLLFGACLTFSVQSSSITTSLLVPLAGAGLISLESILPVTVGANIGTTTTALLASLSGNIHGLAIALAHLFFNIMGTLIWFVPVGMRKVPLYLSHLVAERTGRQRRFGVGYILVVFFILPISLIILLD